MCAAVVIVVHVSVVDVGRPYCYCSCLDITSARCQNLALGHEKAHGNLQACIGKQTKRNSVLVGGLVAGLVEAR